MSSNGALCNRFMAAAWNFLSTWWGCSLDVLPPFDTSRNAYPVITFPAINHTHSHTQQPHTHTQPAHIELQWLIKCNWRPRKLQRLGLGGQENLECGKTLRNWNLCIRLSFPFAPGSHFVDIKNYEWSATSHPGECKHPPESWTHLHSTTVHFSFSCIKPSGGCDGKFDAETVKTDAFKNQIRYECINTICINRVRRYFDATKLLKCWLLLGRKMCANFLWLWILFSFKIWKCGCFNVIANK